MPFAGLDIHKKVVEAARFDDEGHLLGRHRFPMTRDQLETFARTQLSPEYRVAVEATTNTWAVAAILKPYVAEVVVSNPLRTRAIAEAKVKTDQVDARVLAHLLRCDYLPRVWQPDPETLERRQRCTRRATITADRTRIKNRIHAVLHQRLIPLPVQDLFSKAGQAWLDQLRPSLDPIGRDSIESQLRLLQQVNQEAALLGKQLAEQAWQDPRLKLLMTLPGVDIAVAHTLLATLGDISRFRSGKSAARYLGLIPSTHQSGDHCYHGPITKQGRSHARWLMVQAAQHLASHPGPLGVFFRRLMKRKTRNIAVVATARKLVTIAWHILKNNEPYRYAQPRSTAAKFARLRLAAGGARRKGGLAKGTPRPANYGSGQGTSAVPALDEIYQRETLPSLSPLPPGEQRMLRAVGAQTFAAQVRQARRVPRAAKRQSP